MRLTTRSMGHSQSFHENKIFREKYLCICQIYLSDLYLPISLASSSICQIYLSTGIISWVVSQHRCVKEWSRWYVVAPDMCKKGKLILFIVVLNFFTDENPKQYGYCSFLNHLQVTILSGDYGTHVTLIDSSFNCFEEMAGSKIYLNSGNS